jgi:hypothetical protein
MVHINKQNASLIKERPEKDVKLLPVHDEQEIQTKSKPRFQNISDPLYDNVDSGF